MPLLIHKAALPLAPEDPVIAAADRMIPRVRDAFLAAVEQIQSRIVLRDLERAIETGDYQRVYTILDVEGRFTAALNGTGLQVGIQSVREAIQATYAAGAAAAIGVLPQRVGVQLAFDLLNPRSVRFLQQYQMDLIREVSAQQKETVRQVVERAFREGGHPYEQARTIRGSIGLTARQERAVANFRAGLERGESADLRQALSRSLRDGRYDRTLLRALNTDQGLRKDQIDAMVERYRARYLKYRAENIARTETIRASMRGQMETWRQAIEQGLIPETARRKWITARDENVCTGICKPLDGETAGMDEEFAPGISEPPDPHPSCRCTLVLEAKSLRRAA